MAKLKAYGRTEIFRVSKEQDTPDDKNITWEKDEVALMTDGNFLQRRVVIFRDRFGNYRHDYGWKVKSKIKPGITAERALEHYLKGGYKLDSSSPAHFVKHDDQIAGRTDAPVRTEAKAAREQKSKIGRMGKIQAAKRKAHGSHNVASGQAGKGYYDKEIKGDGPGLYVTNQYMGSRGLASGHHRVAEVGPFEDYEAAEEAAWDRFNEFLSMQFQYLLPVEIIESQSRDDAEMDKGYVWWIDGKQKGPQVDPRQSGFTW